MAWKKLCEEFPNMDEPILIKSHGKTFYGIREQDEDGDFIHCQNELQGDFAFSILLSTPFNDPAFLWRYFDD